jgi:hypothetical protein
MFNLCSPGATVNFDVTFKMPFQRNSLDQLYEFDLGIYAGANLIGRQRVLLDNPALSAASYYRYYNASAPGVCPSGTHVVWGTLSYAAICPQDGAGDYSQIRFCAEVGATADAADQHTPGNPIVDVDSGTAKGCAAGEVLLGVATAVPATGTAAELANSLNYKNTCSLASPPGMGTSSGFNVGVILQNAGMMATDSYLKIRYELDPSMPGGAVAPYLTSWNLDFDCVPTE